MFLFSEKVHQTMKTVNLLPSALTWNGVGILKIYMLLRQYS
jgi:hypothetical protein